MKPAILLLWAVILLLSACSGDRKQPTQINKEASLPASFKFSTAGLKLMASFIDKRTGTMSVLYSAGKTRTLITWKQKSDENWLGANIPGELRSVEIVKTAATRSGQIIDYKNYNGKGSPVTRDTAWQKIRTNYILAQQPSIVP